MDPDNYYYYFDNHKRKIYYDILSQTKIAVGKIPKGIVSKIKENKLAGEAELVRIIRQKQKEIEDLQKEITSIRDMLGDRNYEDIESERIKQEEIYKKKRQEEKARQDKQREEKARQDKQREEKARQEEKIYGVKEFLAQKGIYNKKDVNRWLLNGGHPDKGGDQEICKQVLEAANKLGFYI